MQHDLSIFNTLIKNQARKFKPSSVTSQEDIEQECWLKLWEVMPHLQEVSTTEVLFMASTILSNHVTDVIRKSRTRSHINCRFEPPMEIDIEDAIANQLYEFSTTVPQHLLPADEVCEFRQLVDDIREWAVSKGDPTKKLAIELVDPSDETLQAWSEVNESDRYKNAEILPPATLGKILDMSKPSVCKIMQEMKFYLQTIGYQPDSIAVH